MWQGTCEELVPVDPSRLADWALNIPLEEWPQQPPVDHLLRPAFINADSWHGVGPAADNMIEQLLPFLGKPSPMIRDKMISIVQPGHNIHRHADTRGDTWITRIHVPLLTNADAIFMVDDVPYRLRVGMSYLVNVSRPHAVINNGKTPRYHFMFDCYEPC